MNMTVFLGELLVASIHIQSRPVLMHVALPDVSMLTLITIQIDLMEITNLLIKD